MADGALICDGVNTCRFKIKKLESGRLNVVDPDGRERTLADLSEEERRVIEFNFSGSE